MKKISLLIFILFAVSLLAGCVEKKLPDSTQAEQRMREKQAAADKVFEEGGTVDEIDDSITLSDEETAKMEKLQQEADAAELEKVKTDYDIVHQLENLEENKKNGSAAKGSCDAISQAATCIDYIGSMWTIDQMKNNCNSSGTFSTKPCPSGKAGGCNVGTGLQSDMVTWFYTNGVNGVTADSIKYMQAACNANPLGRWVTF